MIKKKKKIQFFFVNFSGQYLVKIYLFFLKYFLLFIQIISFK